MNSSTVQQSGDNMSESTESHVILVLENRNRYHTAKDMARELNMSRSRISSILKSLYNRDILIAKKRGTKVYYKLNEEAYRDLKYTGKIIEKHDLQKDMHLEKDRQIAMLFFSHRDDVVTLHRRKTLLHSLESLEYRISEKAILSYIESFTYPTNIDLWELSPGYYTNYDIDILSIRSNPEFIGAVATKILRDNRSIIEKYDGIICIRKKEEKIKTPISGTYTKNSVPYAVCLALKTDMPIIITDGKEIEDMIEKHSCYLLIDDYPVPGDSIEKIIKSIQKKAIVDIFTVFERDGSAIDQFRKSKITTHSMFHLSDIMKNVHSKINVLSNPQYR